ncbi:MAG TPA: 50S ribosomal protein L24 [Candidatus Dormibacteraeota bacterium]|nr:50S ribosomal protein L24 [Candidatus Dormibacteraeota bacterium]
MSEKIYKLRIKKGDMVIIRSGKYKGQTGKVTTTIPKQNKLIIDGINIVKKHQKPNREYPQGGIIDITKPIWASKVAIVDPLSKRPSRIGFKIDSKGTKTRYYKTSGKEIK